MTHDRRSFLKTAAGAAGLSLLPPNLRAALADPAPARSGTIKDVEHVVILMQENRSFDHYFGTLRGVRGFNDPRAIVLPGGQPVWHQPKGAAAVAPFHLDTRSTAAQHMQSLDHSWKGSHDLWKHHDAWIATKTEMTMGYFTRADIPFYYALADSFTVCDAYYCSVFGPTNPNRLYLFTGTSGLSVRDDAITVVANPPDETNETADPANDAPAFKPLEWTTYAERLQRAGIDWRVYQEYDNFGDNALAYFWQFRRKARKSLLRDRARSWAEGSNAANAKASRGEYLVAEFARDVATNRLPQVSWIVAPTIMCEHPAAPPSYGEHFVSRLLDALAANKEVWSKTVFILNYDENDGFFDHMPPPLPPITVDLGQSTADLSGEAYQGVPFGFGPRVPMLVVSPWTTGGFVNSEVFDHTSVIRFLETRFGVAEPNISAWRRAVAGDLTSVFDFARADAPPLPRDGDGLARADGQRAYPPAMARTDAPAVQEAGHRPARALPYDFEVSGFLMDEGFVLSFFNSGKAGAAFRATAGGGGGPWYFTVGAGESILHVLPCAARYDFTLHGPNGFYRRFAGRRGQALESRFVFDRAMGGLRIHVDNDSEQPVTVHIRDGYAPARAQTKTLVPGSASSAVVRPDLTRSANWYDVTVEGPDGYLHQFAGHIEDGKASVSDPQLG